MGAEYLDQAGQDISDLWCFLIDPSDFHYGEQNSAASVKVSVTDDQLQ